MDMKHLIWLLGFTAMGALAAGPHGDTRATAARPIGAR